MHIGSRKPLWSSRSIDKYVSELWLLARCLFDTKPSHVSQLNKCLSIVNCSFFLTNLNGIWLKILLCIHENFRLKFSAKYLAFCFFQNILNKQYAHCTRRSLEVLDIYNKNSWRSPSSITIQSVDLSPPRLWWFTPLNDEVEYEAKNQRTLLRRKHGATRGNRQVVSPRSRSYWVHWFICPRIQRCFNVRS